MKKIKFDGKFIANVGIFSALGLVFDLLASLIGFDPWSSGGSISIAMLPIFIMAYYYGAVGGLLTGFIIGSIQLLWGSPAGFPGAMLDYVLPYTSAGLAGFIFNKYHNMDNKVKKYCLLSISMIVAGLVRVFFHTLSGVVLYEATWAASFIYNAPYVLISIVICAILTNVLVDRLNFVFGKNQESDEE